MKLAATTSTPYFFLTLFVGLALTCSGLLGRSHDDERATFRRAQAVAGDI